MVFFIYLQLSRPTNVLIFHMSSLFTVLTLCFVVLSSPSLLKTDPSQFILGPPFCVFHGIVNLLGHPLALWTVAGIHLDRFISIVHPLRLVLASVLFSVSVSIHWGIYIQCGCGKTKSWLFTVWNFLNFPATTQILNEINFDNFEVHKLPFLQFWMLSILIKVNFMPQKWQNSSKSKLRD